MTRELGGSPLWGYVGLQGSAWASERLDDSVRAKGGARLDLLWTGQTLRTRLRADGGWSTDASRPAWRISAEQALNVTRQLSVRLGLSREQDFDVHETAAQAVLYGYF